MPVFSKRIGGSALAAVLAAVISFGSSAVSAAPVVNFNIQVQNGTAGPAPFSQVGSPTANPEIFEFTEAGSAFPTGIINADWEISDWYITADDDAGGTHTEAYLDAQFTVKNKSLNNIQFSITLDMDVQPANATFFIYSGGLTLTSDSAAPGTVSTTNAFNANAPMWTYLVDGSSVATAYNSGFSFSVLNGPDTDAPAVDTSFGALGGNPGNIAIRIDFDLSPGEILLLNGNFTYIPAPGALALLGLAGLVGSRRRR